MVAPTSLIRTPSPPPEEEKKGARACVIKGASEKDEGTIADLTRLASCAFNGVVQGASHVVSVLQHTPDAVELTKKGLKHAADGLGYATQKIGDELFHMAEKVTDAVETLRDLHSDEITLEKVKELVCSSSEPAPQQPVQPDENRPLVLYLEDAVNGNAPLEGQDPWVVIGNPLQLEEGANDENDTMI